jgi:hypothetical protein
MERSFGSCALSGIDIVRQLFASLLVLTACSVCSATPLPAEAPADDVIKRLFADHRAFAAVRVSTSDQLIAAMTAANEGHRPTIIEVAPGTYEFTQVFNSDFGPGVLPPVTVAMIIQGHGAANTIFDGLNEASITGRPITVLAGGRVVVRYLTIQNFLVMCEFDCATNGGGAAENAGGDLRFEDSVLTGNSALSLDGGPTLGGAVFNQAGRLELERTTISNNATISAGGGGIAITAGTAVLKRSIVTGNVSFKGCCGDLGGQAWGGGLYANNAKVALVGSTVSENRVGAEDFDEPLGFGAGIYNDGAKMWLVDSAIVNNHGLSSGLGGGIQNSGTLLILNSTIGGNTVGSRGGGIYNAGKLTLQGVTIANNSSRGLPMCFFGPPSECDAGGNGLWTNPGAIVEIATSVIDDCAPGTLITEGHNAFGPGEICILQPADFLARGNTHDRVNINPDLGPLTDNGFAGNAHYPPLVGSPLMDAGGKIGRFCTRTDQNGQRRVTATDPDDRTPLCDIGASEYQPPKHHERDGDPVEDEVSAGRAGVDEGGRDDQ